MLGNRLYRQMGLFLWLAFCLISWAHASPNRSLGLRVLQSITDPTAPTMSLTAELVGVSFGASLAPTVPQERKTPHSEVANIPFVAYGWETRSPAQILEIAKGIMTVSRGQQVATELRRSMNNAKAGSAVFLYDQEVRPKAAGRDMRLVWSVTIMDNGRVLIPEPKLVDPDPTVLHLTYISSDADDLLPVGWAYTDGGFMMWQVKKQDGTPVTELTRVNTFGAFNEVNEDSERMLQCLANRSSHSSCPSAYKDAWTLMDDTASGSAIIDYTRKMSPVYDEVTNSAGEIEYRPRFTLSVDHRDYMRDSCVGGQYRNRGRKGYLLETSVDRYKVLPTRPATRVNTFKKQDISPTENYDISTAVQSTASALASQIVHPFDASLGLVRASEFPEITYLAPVVTTTTGDAHTNLSLQGTQSDMAYNWQTVGQGKNRLTFGTIADNYWGNGVYDRSMSFNLSNKDIYSEFRIVRAYFDDWLKVEVNGRLVYVGPYGGDRLETFRTTGRFPRTRVRYCATCTGPLELSTSWNIGLNIDLLPHLKNGQNLITMRTIVAGRGEGAIQIDTSSCLLN